MYTQARINNMYNKKNDPGKSAAEVTKSMNYCVCMLSVMFCIQLSQYRHRASPLTPNNSAVAEQAKSCTATDCYAWPNPKRNSRQCVFPITVPQSSQKQKMELSLSF